MGSHVRGLELIVKDSRSVSTPKRKSHNLTAVGTATTGQVYNHCPSNTTKSCGYLRLRDENIESHPLFYHNLRRS